MANKSSITIDVALKTDIKGLLSEIDDIVLQAEQKVGSIKTLGLTRGAKNDVNAIEGMIAGLKKEIDNLSHSKVNTTTFSKAQQSLLDKVQELEQRTLALENGMSTLVNTMSSADGTRFAAQMKDIATTMTQLSDATEKAVDAVRQVSDVSDKTKDLNDMAKSIQSVLDAFDSAKKTQNYSSMDEAFKGVMEAYGEYADIQEKMLDLIDAGVEDTAAEKQLLALQKDLVKAGDTITETIQKTADKLGDSFYDMKDKWGYSILQISDLIDQELNEIQDSVVQKQENITKELAKVQAAQDALDKQPKKKPAKKVSVKNKQDDSIVSKADVVAKAKPVLEAAMEELGIDSTEALTDTLSDNIQNSVHDAVNEAANELRKSGEAAVEAVEEGIREKKDSLKDTWIEVFRGTSHSDPKYRQSTNNDQTFYATSMRAAKTYGSNIHKAYIDSSKMFHLQQYGNYYDELTFLGDGISEESKEVIQLHGNIIKTMKDLEKLVTETFDTDKKNDLISEFHNKATGEIIKVANSYTSFTDKIKDAGFVKTLESFVTELDDVAKGKLKELIDNLVSYQDFLDKHKKASGTYHKYGNEISTDSYAEYLQKSGAYTGLYAHDIYDDSAAHTSKGLTDDAIIFGSSWDEVVKANYLLKGSQKAFEKYDEMLIEKLDTTTSTKLGALNKEIISKLQKLNSANADLSSYTGGEDGYNAIAEDIQKDTDDLLVLIEQKELLKQRLVDFQSNVDKLNQEGKSWNFNKGFAGILNNLDQISSMPESIQDLLKQTGIMSKNGGSTLKKISGGYANKGVYQNDEVTIIERAAHYSEKIDRLMPKLAKAAQEGLSVGEIIGKVVDAETGLVYELQSTVSGENIAKSDEYLKATDEQVLKLYEDIEKLNKLGLYIDVGGDNLMYDKDNGFSFIDLADHADNTNKDYVAKNAKDTVDRYFKGLNQQFLDRIYQVVPQLASTAAKDSGADNVKKKAEELIDTYKKLQDEWDGLSFSDLDFGDVNDALNDVKKQIVQAYKDVSVEADKLSADALNGIIPTDEAMEAVDAWKMLGEQLEKMGYNLDELEGKSKNTFESLMEDANKVINNSSASAEELIDTFNTLNEKYQEANTNLSHGIGDEGQVTMLDNAMDQVADKLKNLGYEWNSFSGEWQEDNFPFMQTFDDTSDSIDKASTALDDFIKEVHTAEELLGDDTSLKHFNDVFHGYQDDLFDSVGTGLERDFEDTLSMLEEYAKKCGYVWDSVADEWAEGTNKIEGYVDKAKESVKRMLDGDMSVENFNRVINQIFDAYDAAEWSGALEAMDGNPFEDQLKAIKSLGAELGYVYKLVDDGKGSESLSFVKADDIKDTSAELNKIADGLDELHAKSKELGEDVFEPLEGRSLLRGNFTLENFNKVYEELCNTIDKIEQTSDELDTSHVEAQIEDLTKEAEKYGYALQILDDGSFGFGTIVNDLEESLDSAPKGLEKEAQDFIEISDASEKAATSKEEFVKANANVLQSIISSLAGLDNEGKAFENLNKLINNLGGKNGGDKLDATVSGLREIVSLLSSPVDESSFITALQKISESGSNLSDIATILKASKKELLQAQDILNDLGSDALDDLLKNNAQDIVKNAKAELLKLGGDGAQFINISNLNKTKDGFIEIVGLIKTADNNMQEFTLHTKDGIQMQNVGMSENTAKIAKQMKIYAQVQQYFDKMQAQGKNITEQPFFDKNAEPEIWQMLIDYAKTYHAELGEIQNITMQTRQDAAGGALFESFSINGTNGHLTVGREGETVASNQQLLNVTELQNRIEALTKKTKEYYSLIQKKDSAGWTKADEAELQKITSEYEEIVSLVKEYSRILGDSSNITEVFGDAVNKMTVSFNNIEQSYIDKAQKVLSDAFDNPNNKNVAYTPTFLGELDETLTKVKELQTLINSHGNTNAPWSDDEIARIKELHTAIDGTVGSVKDLENVAAKSSSIDKLLTKINKDLNDNTAMPKELKLQYIALRDEIDEVRNSLDGLNKVDFSRLESSFNSLHQEMTRTGKLGKSMIDKIAEAAQSQTVQFLARYFSLQDMVRYTREMAQNVINIDSALTELRKVSDASTERLNQSFEKSTETAQELGQTIQHVINVTADWARLGYNVDQAEELARVTALFTSVGDNMSADDASSYLISTLQGFQLGVDQAQDIVDKYNQVANNFAIDTAGIGEALKRSAASFNAANTDLSKAIALVTATNEVVQNPESVGTLWKTMSARIRGAKTELEDLGEEEDEFTKTTSKLRDLVKALTGFDIMKTETEFKDIYEILLGIGKEWDNLTDIERASLGEALAGKRNANALYAVLGNLDTLQEAYEAAEHSAGSAAKEQENYAQSVQYSLDRFKASIEELSYDFLNSQLLKDLVEAGNTVIRVLDKIVESFGGVEVAVGVVSAVLGVKFRKEIGSGLLNVIDILGKTTKATDDVVDALEGGAAALEAIQNGAELGADGMLHYSGAIVKTSKALGLLKLGGIAIGIAAVTAALYVGYKAWDNYQTTVKEWNDKIDETTNKISSLETEIKNLRNIDFRTNEEQTRLENLKQELEYEKRLLEIQKERAAIQAYGFNTPAQQWDADNAVKTWKKEIDSQAHIGGGMGADEYFGMEYNAGMLSKATDDIRAYDEQLAKLSARSEEYGEIIEKKRKTESEAAEYVQTLTIKTGDYYEELKKAQAATEYLEVGSNAYIHNQQLIESYQEMIDLNERVIESYQKTIGTYDYTSVVDSLFQHSEYEKVKDELVEIAKAGDLTKESLEFSDDELIKSLIFDLKAAGVEADVLYQYILKLAGVTDKENLIDKINGQIKHDSGGANVSGLEYDYKKISKFINRLNDEQLQIVAGLDVDWSTFSADDFISKAQKEIDRAGKLEVKVKVDTDSFTQNISDLNDLETALNSVGNAIANIDEHGNFQLSDLDSIADYFLGLEAAEEKVEYETEAVANALKMLGEGSGTVEQQANAINTLADNYLHTSGILDGLTEKNKELYIIRLKEMGIINAEEIVTATLNAQLEEEARAREIVAIQAQAEAEAKALIASETVDLTNLTAEEVNALLEEGTITQETALKLLDMAIQKQMVNGNVLTTTGDIANLTALCSSLGVAGSALERYAEMRRIAMDDSGKYTPEYQAGTLKRANQMLQNAIKAAYNTGGAEYNVPKAQYNGGEPVKNKLGYTPSSTANAISDAAAKAAEEAAKKAADSAKDAFKEIYDYFERMIKVLDQSVDLLEAHLEDVVGSFAKNSLLDSEEQLIQKKINGYSSAIDMYSQKASEALSKIPSDIAAKLLEGAVDIDEFIGEGNEEVVEAIQEYEKWADKVNDCKLNIVQLKEAIRQLELKKFNNVMKDFTDQFDLRQSAGIDLISKQIDLLKEAGELVGESFYQKQIDQANKQLQILSNEQAALVTQMNEALSNGIDRGSEEWLEMVNALTEVEGKILDTKKAVEEFDNALLALHTEVFNRIQDQFSAFKNELSNMRELIADDSLPVATVDNKWTDEGITQLGLLTQEYELASYQVEQFNDEIDKLNADYLAGKYSATEYADALIDLKERQWDAVNAAEAAKEAIVDLNKARVDIVVEGIEDEIDAYRKLIEAQKDALAAEKDLHDYRKQIAESNKTITALERQLAAMADDDTAATIAKRKKLEEQLAEARENLDEQEYSHSIESQQDALDEQLKSYEELRQKEIEVLQESLLNEELIIAESFERVRENSQLIGETILATAQEHGIEMSAALTDSWFAGENAVAHYGDVLSDATSAFIGSLQDVEVETYELQNRANETADGLANMFATRADSLVDELVRSYTGEANLDAMTNALHDSLSRTIDGNYSGASAAAALESIANAARDVGNAAVEATEKIRDLINAQDGYFSSRKNDPSTNVTTIYGGPDAGKTVSWKWDKNGQIDILNGVRNHYAQGTKGVSYGQLAWTQEQGPEMIISPTSGAILTPLSKGDSVLPTDQTANIWEWSKFDPTEFAKRLIQSMPNAGGNVQANTMQIGSLVTVNGNVNDTMEMMQIAATTASTKIKQSFNELSDGLNK